MYCSNCGTHLANSSVICYNCGAKVDAESCSQYPVSKVKPLVDLDRPARSKNKRKKGESRRQEAAVAESASSDTRDASPDTTPEAREKKPVNKKLVAGCCIVAVLVIACVVAVNKLNETVFSPTAFVEEYFEAIADGDVAKAASMTKRSDRTETIGADAAKAHDTVSGYLAPRTLDVDQNVIVSAVEGSLDDPANRISNISVGDIDGEGHVVVGYEIDGEPYQSTITVKESSPRFVLFKGYAITGSAEVPVPVSNCGPNHLLLNGVEFELPSLPNNDYPVNVKCLPGKYTLSAPESDLYTSDSIKFIVGSSVTTEHDAAADAAAVGPSANDPKTAYTLSMVFSDDLLARADEDIVAYITGRLEQDDPQLDESPVRARITTNSTFKGWGDIRALPQPKVVEGDARKATSAQLIKNGSVLYAVTAGGSVSYAYMYDLSTARETHEKSASASIARMEIYLNLQTGDMNIAYNGKFIYGPLALAIGNQGEGLAWIDGSLFDPAFLEAMEDLRAGL